MHIGENWNYPRDEFPDRDKVGCDNAVLDSILISYDDSNICHEIISFSLKVPALIDAAPEHPSYSDCPANGCGIKRQKVLILFPIAKQNCIKKEI
jgi:hypothetical protein